MNAVERAGLYVRISEQDKVKLTKAQLSKSIENHLIYVIIKVIKETDTINLKYLYYHGLVTLHKVFYTLERRIPMEFLKNLTYF